MTTTPKRAARETDFYSLGSPDLDPYQVPPLLFETLLSKVEAWGKEFIDAAVADPGFVIDDELRARFSRYMGFQYVRGRSARWFAEAAANDLIKIKYEDVTDDGIRNMLAENGEVTDRQIGRFREFLDGCGHWKDQDHAARAAMVAMLGQQAESIGFSLFIRGWHIYQVPPILVTCEEPVVAIAGPPHPRGERAGVADAGVVIFPLTPSLLLAMFDGVARPVSPYRLDHCDIAEVNREIVAAASGYAFERLGRNTAAAFQLPNAADPMHRSDPMPMGNTGLRRLIRVHRPSRWADEAAPPPWPVERWFQAAQTSI